MKKELNKTSSTLAIIGILVALFVSTGLGILLLIISLIVGVSSKKNEGEK